MTANKIVCATDFLPGSESALRTAARLANELDAVLEIVHSWHVPASAFSELTYPADLVQAMHEDAQLGIDLALREARTVGANRVISKLLTGVPWVAVAGEAEDPACKIVVVGSHRRVGMSRILLGSVAERIVRHSPCSVLVVPPSTVDAPFKHALCAVDFSDASRDAMLAGAELVRPRGRVTLMHAVEIPSVAVPRETPSLQYAMDADQRSHELLDKWTAELRRVVDIPVAKKSETGRPATEILAALDADPTIDVVVIGSHGRTGIKRVLLGSVAEKVVRHSRCPVLVARKRS